MAVEGEGTFFLHAINPDLFDILLAPSKSYAALLLCLAVSFLALHNIDRLQSFTTC